MHTQRLYLQFNCLKIKTKCKYLTQNQCFKAHIPEKVRKWPSIAKRKKDSVSYATEETNMKFLHSRRITEDGADSWVLLKEDFKQKYLNSWD